MKLQVLDRIHEGHQGIVNCGEPAKTSVWWPGLSCEVQEWQKIANFLPSTDSSELSHSCQHPFLNVLADD